MVVTGLMGSVEEIVKLLMLRENLLEEKSKYA